MGTHRTAWHFFFAILLRKRGPRCIEVREEVPLAEEPPRLDYLFLRKLAEVPADDPGQTLRGLWRRLPKNTIAELKTIGRPYRTRNLDRLWAYLHLHFADPACSIESAADLAGLLLVLERTPALNRDAEARGLAWHDLGDGYWELTGGLFRLFVAEIDAVAEREDDDMLRLFGHAKERTLEARRFWAEQVGTKEAMMAAQDLEGYDEVTRKFLELLTPEQRVAGLTPEQRVAGLAPEQRVAGLAPEQVLLALSDEALRAFSEDYVAHLPEPVRTTVRKRRAR